MGKVLSGGKWIGGNPEHERVENDYYATDPKAVKMLSKVYKSFEICNTFLEPCVGEGHIANAIKEVYNRPVTTVDIQDRGYEGTIVADFLNWETDKRFDGIITNPPYSLATEFTEKSLSLLNDNGKMAMFLRIQFLEGVKRDILYSDYPPKYVYVFKKRISTWRNGEDRDPEGKKWSTTMCHAWFVWEKGYKGPTIVERI